MAESDPTGRLGHPKFVCAHCSRVFTRYPSVIKHDPPKYCGNVCRHEAFNVNGWPASKPTQTVVCETCGKREDVSPSAAKTRRFCSQACMLVWRAPVLRNYRFEPEKHENRICKWCGKEFSTHSCRVKDGRGDYCSRACVGSATVASFGDSRTSKAEVLFGDLLRSQGLDFEPQKRFSKWSVDYWFPAHMVVVEFDGDYWHSLERVKRVDAQKDAYLQSKGCKVVRIAESYVKKDPIKAVQIVRDALRSQ